MTRQLVRVALFAPAAALLLACSPIQTVNYPVREPDGRTIAVDKYYSSLLDGDPGDRSFKQIQAGHVDDALATMKAQVASSPTDASAHYDLAIIHEIKADWPSALLEIKEANRLGVKDQTYIDEQKFIEQHVPKK
jgi:hypothetical protein